MNEKQVPIPENEDLDMNINADADIPGNTHLSEPLEENNDEVSKLSQALEEQKDKFIRQAAEFDNFRKRTAKERLELIQTAGKDVINSLLEVLDDCDRAELEMEKSADMQQVKEGTLLVFNKLRSVLKARGLQAMESLGTEFDMEKHDAITQIDVEEKHKGKVVDVVQKGYYLNDNLIRHAKVVVGK